MAEIRGGPTGRTPGDPGRAADTASPSHLPRPRCRWCPTPSLSPGILGRGEDRPTWARSPAAPGAWPQGRAGRLLMPTQHVALLSLPPPSPSAPGQRGGGAGLASCSLLENAEAQRLSALPGSQRGRTGDPHSGSDPNPPPTRCYDGHGCRGAGGRVPDGEVRFEGTQPGAGRRGATGWSRTPAEAGAGWRLPRGSPGPPRADGGATGRAAQGQRAKPAAHAVQDSGLARQARCPCPVPASMSSIHAPSDVVPRSVGSGGRDGQSTVRPDSLQVSKPGSRRGGWEGQSHTGSAQALTAGTLCLEKRH